MTKLPPFLPEVTLHRVLRVARLDGMSMTFVAGFFALISAVMSDGLGAITGVLVAGAGAVELHGATMLEHGDSRGTRWLINSQLLALGSILAYCAIQLWRANVPEFPGEVDAIFQQGADQVGISKHDYLLFVFNRLLYSIVAAVTLIYQGRMTLYYFQRRDAVARALAVEE